MSGIIKKSGHAVTGVLPPHADGAQVAPANIQFQQAPGYQSSGMGGPKANSGMNAYKGGAKSKGSFPPAR